MDAATPVDFAREVRPLLVKRCLACHDAAHAKGGLCLMGLDHEKLTYFYQRLEQRITGVRGEVIKKALA